MIVSHLHKFIFLKTRKVAGTSIEIALSSICGPDDIITPITANDEAHRRALGFRGAQNYGAYAFKRSWRPVKSWATAAYNHMPARDVRTMIGTDIWNDYFKFSVVRDPFDCLVSLYYWRHKRAKRAPLSLDDYAKANPEELLQNRRLYSIGAKIAVDRLVRYENLEHDLGEVSDRLGLDHNIHDVVKTISAKSGMRPEGRSLAEEYAGAPDAVALVTLLCAQEMDRYGYRVPTEFAAKEGSAAS